jgi:Carboxypeptidase regulatory-like domain
MTKGASNVIRSGILAALFLICFASAVLSFDKKDKEDEKLRMVQGQVTDAGENPIVGAVVQLKNAKTLQVRSFITQEKGSYQFHGLDPNVDYSLKADYQGASSPVRTLSAFDSRKQPVINLKIEGKK